MVVGKSYLKCHEIYAFQVLHYRILNSSDLLKFGKNKGKYLLNYEYQKYRDQQLLWNVLNTVLEIILRGLLR